MPSIIVTMKRPDEHTVQDMTNLSSRSQPTELRFSIAMAAYNGARYLAEQLASFCSQRPLPYELVVCDDASTDSTARIVADFKAAAPFPVRIVRNRINSGHRRSFERAIALCAGDWIALSDQDDRWRENKLGAVARVVKANPRAGAVFTDAAVIDENGQSLGFSLWESVGFDSARQMAFRRNAGRVLLSEWVVTGATLVFRASHRPLVLPLIDPSGHGFHPLHHDTWIPLMISCVADVLPLSTQLIDYRVHPGQQIGTLDPRMPRQSLSASQPKEANRGRVIANLPELRSVVERLALVGEGELTAVGHDIQSQFKHLTTRMALPAERKRRLTLITREMMTWRYHRYSNGLHSVVRDLLG